jgi:hypothetical protein
VAAAINNVSHNGNHTSSVATQDATVVVASCGATLPIVFHVLLSSHKPALIGSGTPQDASTTVVACGVMPSVW